MKLDRSAVTNCVRCIRSVRHFLCVGTPNGEPTITKHTNPLGHRTIVINRVLMGRVHALMQISGSDLHTRVQFAQKYSSSEYGEERLVIEECTNHVYASSHSTWPKQEQQWVNTEWFARRQNLHLLRVDTDASQPSYPIFKRENTFPAL